MPINCCCGSDQFEIIPYDETINEKSCCKCYHRYYYEDFHICPGVRCTIDTCFNQLEGDNYKSPPCASCSLLCCPISYVIDMISCPIRFCDRKHYDKKQKTLTDYAKGTHIAKQPSRTTFGQNGSEPVLGNQPSYISY